MLNCWESTNKTQHTYYRIPRRVSTDLQRKTRRKPQKRKNNGDEKDGSNEIKQSDWEKINKTKRFALDKTEDFWKIRK